MPVAPTGAAAISPSAVGPPAREGVAVLVASVASFLTPFSGSATNVALPAIGRDLGLGAVLLSWVGMAYLLAAAASLVPAGRLADIHGRRRVFTWGVVVYGAASFVSALAPGWAALILARAIQGVGGAAIFGTNVAILTSVLPPGRRGTALGLNVAAVYLGLSLGPPLGGVLTQQTGWRSLYLLTALLSVPLLALVRFGLQGEWAEAKGEPFDARGAALYAGGLLAAMYGVSRLPSPDGGLLLLAGLLLTLGFVAWEGRAPHPLMRLELFLSNRVFAFSNLAALINYSATFAVGFLLSLYLQYVRRLDAQAAGLLLAAQPAAMAAVSPFAGRLSDRVEARVVASLGMAATALGLLALCALGSETPLAAVVGALLVLGCGFGLFSSPNTNAVMNAVERPQYGLASASLGTMRLCGQMLSLAIASSLLALCAGGGPLAHARPAELVAGVRVAFAVFSALCVAGIFASLARGGTPTSPRG